MLRLARGPTPVPRARLESAESPQAVPLGTVVTGRSWAVLVLVLAEAPSSLAVAAMKAELQARPAVLEPVAAPRSRRTSRRAKTPAS